MKGALKLYSLGRSKLQGEVGTATWTFAVSALIRVGSSMLLTRLLSPEIYGVVTMAISVLIFVEMISDLGFTLLILRHENAESKDFLNTIWTVRLFRSFINAIILWFLAPLIADLFNASQHVDELRVACIVCLLQGCESFGLTLAIRHQSARIYSMVDLGASAISTTFAVSWTYYVDRSAWGLIVAMAIHRGLISIASYTVVDYHRRPALRWDSKALDSMKTLARASVLGSLCTLSLQQLDKFIIGRTLPLSVMGTYGIGQNISGMAEGLSSRLLQSVVLPRVTSLVRTKPSDEIAHLAFAESRRPIFLALASPVILGFFANDLVGLLYDSRYAAAGLAIQAFCVRALLTQYGHIGSQVLAAAGHDRVLVVPSLLRAITLAVAASIGVSFGGMNGLLIAVALEPISALIYIKLLQVRTGLLARNAEWQTFALVGATAITSYAMSIALSSVIHKYSSPI